MASEAEIKGFFIELDADGDGWINQTTDLQALVSRVGCNAAAAMATVSTVVGNPHYINFEEFCNLLAKINNADSGPSEAEVLQEMFTMFDTDCDGFLTLSDLRAIFAKASIESMGLVTPCSEAELHNMIQEADPSGEGKLNFDAFKHVVEQCV